MVYMKEQSVYNSSSQRQFAIAMEMTGLEVELAQTNDYEYIRNGR